MNIFVLDNHPKRAAKFHVDKHVVKMPLETAQMLCSAHHMSGTNSLIPYKLAYRNHPCTKWVRESYKNYLWLCYLGIEICYEYTYRYNKIHKSQIVIEWCINNTPNIPKKNITKFAQAMPNKYKCEDPVKAYRSYYIGEKSHLFSWKHRGVPLWIN